MGKPLRIAVVTETYPPEVNGVAMSISRIVNGLLALEQEVQLIRPRQSQADCGAQRPGFTQVLTSGFAIPRYAQLKVGFPAFGCLKSLWKQARPDIVHLATEGPLGWSALHLALRMRIPVVSEFRTNFHAYSQHYGIGWLQGTIQSYLRYFHNKTLRTMVPTASLAAELNVAGFKRLEVVARGVDTRLFHPDRRSRSLRESWGCDDSSLVVMHVGRLAPEKNLEVLRDAFRAMRAVNPGSRLVLVGDGPARRQMSTSCPEAVFAGMRSGEDLASHYASADILLFPSITETYGNVTPEAMASGVCVLAYNYAAAAELIRHGHSGWLAPFNNPGAFIDQAHQAARHAKDARILGSFARKTAEGLGWDNIVNLVQQHYRTAITSVSHASPATSRTGYRVLETSPG